MHCYHFFNSNISLVSIVTLSSAQFGYVLCVFFWVDSRFSTFVDNAS